MSTIELRKLMQSDLERYFRLNAHIETRKTKCWVLTIDDTAKIQSKGGKVIDNYDLTNFKLTMVNVPIIQMRIRFIYHLLEHSPFPFVDETGYSGNVDIRLEDIKIDDLESMAKALNKYQMKLQLKEREVNFLIIRESK